MPRMWSTIRRTSSPSGVPPGSWVSTVRIATRAQPVGEVPRSRGLAAALGSLERDEAPAGAHRQRPPSSGISSTRRFGSEPRERDISALRSAIWCWSRRT